MHLKVLQEQNCSSQPSLQSIARRLSYRDDASLQDYKPSDFPKSSAIIYTHSPAKKIDR